MHTRFYLLGKEGVVCVSALFLFQWCTGAVIHVPAEYPTIQAAIEAAVHHDEIVVAPGEYTFATPLNFRGKIVIVRSEAGPDQTVLSMAETPADSDRASVVLFESGERKPARLEGFKITGGKGSLVGDEPRGLGGGILFVNHSSPEVINCVITGNEAGSAGGGAYISDSSPAFQFCQVTENRLRSDEGGAGVHCAGDSQPSFTECTISRNEGFGVSIAAPARAVFTSCTLNENSSGGIACNGPSASSFMDCTVRGSPFGIVCGEDSAPRFLQCTVTGCGSRIGHAVSCYQSAPVFIDCVIKENHSGEFGHVVLCSFGADAAFSDCRITENVAEKEGGGVHCYKAAALFNGCEISGNVCTNGPGGVYVAEFSSATFKDCAIEDNRGTWGAGGVHYARFCTGALTNCTISGNMVVEEYAGGVAILAATVSLDHCTISGNAGSAAGGVYVVI